MNQVTQINNSIKQINNETKTAPETGQTFFHINLLQHFVLIACKRPKINEKEAEDGPYFMYKK